MIIDFNKIDLTSIPHFKAGEGVTKAKIFNDGLNKIMLGTLVPGASIGMHTHETSSEIMYILKGHGYAIYDGVKEELTPGTTHYCPKGHTHCCVNDGNEDFVMLCIVPEQ